MAIARVRVDRTSTARQRTHINRSPVFLEHNQQITCVCVCVKPLEFVVQSTNIFLELGRTSVKGSSLLSQNKIKEAFHLIKIIMCFPSALGAFAHKKDQMLISILTN